MEHKEIMIENLKIESPQYEKVMEVNNEARLNVDEQQDDKTFKVKSDIDNSDEVQEITAARTLCV